MAEAYDFLDSESYRDALRNAEVAEQNVRRAQQGTDSDGNTGLPIAEYRLMIAQNKLNNLGAESLSYYEITRFGWESVLYRHEWPVSRMVIWLVTSTHVSEEHAVAVPLVLAGVIIYGGQLLFFAYRRRRVRDEAEFA